MEYEREEEEALPSSLTTNDQGAAIPIGQSASYFFVSFLFPIFVTRAVFGRVLFSNTVRTTTKSRMEAATAIQRKE